MGDLRLSSPPLILHPLSLHNLPHSLGPEVLLIDLVGSPFELLQKLELGSLSEQPLLNLDVLGKVLHALLERSLKLVIDESSRGLLSTTYELFRGLNLHQRRPSRSLALVLSRASLLLLGLVELLSTKSPLEILHLKLFLVFLEILKLLKLLKLLFPKLLQLLLLELLLKLLLLLEENLLLLLMETRGLGMGMHPRRWGIPLL